MIQIGGLQKITLIDFPQKLAATVFLCGCNFRCPWCYSPQLVLPKKIKKLSKIPEKEFFKFLEEKKNLLEGITICGGEPCINRDLPQFCQKIKKKSFLIKLDTNGSNTQILKELIKNKLIDYVAMDIKQDLNFKKYNFVVGNVLTKKFFENIEKSIKILLKGKVDYEFRTTLVKEFHKKEDIIEICKKIKGAKVYYLQNFEEKEKIISGKKFTPFKNEEIAEIIEEGKRYVNIKPRFYL